MIPLLVRIHTVFILGRKTNRLQANMILKDDVSSTNQPNHGFFFLFRFVAHKSDRRD